MDDFFYQSLVFITISIILVPLSKKLGFGSVLGYLLAGLIVGPYGLKLIKDPESVLHISEVGVVILLFVIGLEMKPKKLWGMRQLVFGLGSVQIIISTIVFSLIFWGLNFDFKLAAALGFAFSLSSTAYAIQTLNEKNQFNTLFGQSSFSILLMQDLAAIPALALIPLFFISQQSKTTSLAVWPIFLVIIFLFLASRFLMRPLFRIIAESNAREIFTAAALFIVLGVAFLMQKIGLSAALGTFLAGMLLAESEYRHELESDIEPFKSIMMGLFFISVGMSVNLNLLSERFLFCVFITIAYLLIKIGIIYFLGLLFRIKKLSSLKMAITIAQGGEFAFVLFAILLKADSAYINTIELGTIVITLSMALNPIILYLADKLIEFKIKNKEINYDLIQNEFPEVIIVGFGRFGQMFGRILKAQKIPFVAIDHNAEQIELVRKFGNKVYFGDATRMELLQSAGIQRAKYFINAIGHVESSIALSKMIKKNFPDMKIFCRARNRIHLFELMDLGISKIRRETYDSSLYLIKELLKEMGYTNSEQIVDLFDQHDEAILLEQYKVRKDEKSLLSVTHQGIAQLEDVLRLDSR